jgi:hypothetical protein
MEENVVYYGYSDKNRVEIKIEKTKEFRSTGYVYKHNKNGSITEERCTRGEAINRLKEELLVYSPEITIEIDKLFDR